MDLRSLVVGISLCVTTVGIADVVTLGPGQGWSTAVSNNGVVAGSSTASAEYFIWTPAGGHQIIGGVSAGSGAGGQAGIDYQWHSGLWQRWPIQTQISYTAAFYTIAYRHMDSPWRPQRLV